ncbi:MAG: hypothetical protein AB1750_07260 [Chloroflexota bacterium]
MTPDPSADERILTLLLARLERISADSPWAHRASGLRVTLARYHEQLEAGRPINDRAVTRLVEQGFHILEAAARERTGGRLK